MNKKIWVMNLIEVNLDYELMKYFASLGYEVQMGGKEPVELMPGEREVEFRKIRVIGPDLSDKEILVDPVKKEMRERDFERLLRKSLELLVK